MAEEIVQEQPKKQEDWMTTKWRPMMAIMYMICCLFDFALFPILFTVVQFYEVESANDAFRQWVPITLQGGGLFHVAMGAVLGVSAFGRTQEKIAGASGNSTSVPTPTLDSTPSPAPVKPVSASITEASPGPVTVGYGGKPTPPKAPQPEI
jgi:hypothetical protein